MVNDNNLARTNHPSYINEKKAKGVGIFAEQKNTLQAQLSKIIQYLYTSLHDLLCRDVG